jgi:hypothetical protein
VATVGGILGHASWLEEIEPGFLVLIILIEPKRIITDAICSTRWRGLSKSLAWTEQRRSSDARDGLAEPALSWSHCAQILN